MDASVWAKDDGVGVTETEEASRSGMLKVSNGKRISQNKTAVPRECEAEIVEMVRLAGAWEIDPVDR